MSTEQCGLVKENQGLTLGGRSYDSGLTSSVGFFVELDHPGGAPGMMTRARRPAQRDRDLLATGGGNTAGERLGNRYISAV